MKERWVTETGEPFGPKLYVGCIPLTGEIQGVVGMWIQPKTSEFRS